MTRHTFQEIVVRAERSGKCDVCGKRWKKVRRFAHTVNPFNRNADGSQKTPREVFADASAEAKAWQPVHCEAVRP